MTYWRDSLSLALVKIFDWLGERCGWVPKEEYFRMVHAHALVIQQLYDAEIEIVRLRKKCGEEWRKEYPHLL